MIKKIIFLILSTINLLLLNNCKEDYQLKSKYLDSKNCYYRINISYDTLKLDYHLVFDTSTFSLSPLDSTRFMVYQSSYFAWHNSYISYRLLKEYPDVEIITVNWKKDSALRKPLYSLNEERSNLLNEYSKKLHYDFITYLIDSIPVEDYFIYNQIMYELYTTYHDSRLTWNLAYLVNRFEQKQCGHKIEDVSSEVFELLYIGIGVSVLSEEKKKELKHYLKFFGSKCQPDKNLRNEKFNLLNLNLK